MAKATRDQLNQYLYGAPAATQPAPVAPAAPATNPTPPPQPSSASVNMPSTRITPLPDYTNDPYNDPNISGRGSILNAPEGEPPPPTPTQQPFSPGRVLLHGLGAVGDIGRDIAGRVPDAVHRILQAQAYIVTHTLPALAVDTAKGLYSDATTNPGAFVGGILPSVVLPGPGSGFGAVIRAYISGIGSYAGGRLVDKRSPKEASERAMWDTITANIGERLMLKKVLKKNLYPKTAPEAVAFGRLLTHDYEVAANRSIRPEKWRDLARRIIDRARITLDSATSNDPNFSLIKPGGRYAVVPPHLTNYSAAMEANYGLILSHADARAQLIRSAEDTLRVAYRDPLESIQAELLGNTGVTLEESDLARFLGHVLYDMTAGSEAKGEGGFFNLARQSSQYMYDYIDNVMAGNAPIPGASKVSGTTLGPLRTVTEDIAKRTPAGVVTRQQSYLKGGRVVKLGTIINDLKGGGDPLEDLVSLTNIKPRAISPKHGVPGAAGDPFRTARVVSGQPFSDNSGLNNLVTNLTSGKDNRQYLTYAEADNYLKKVREIKRDVASDPTGDVKRKIARVERAIRKGLYEGLDIVDPSGRLSNMRRAADRNYAESVQVYLPKLGHEIQQMIRQANDPQAPANFFAGFFSPGHSQGRAGASGARVLALRRLLTHPSYYGFNTKDLPADSQAMFRPLQSYYIQHILNQSMDHNKSIFDPTRLGAVLEGETVSGRLGAFLDDRPETVKLFRNYARSGEFLKSEGRSELSDFAGPPITIAVDSDGSLNLGMISHRSEAIARAGEATRKSAAAAAKPGKLRRAAGVVGTVATLGLYHNMPLLTGRTRAMTTASLFLNPSWAAHANALFTPGLSGKVKARLMAELITEAAYIQLADEAKLREAEVEANERIQRLWEMWKQPTDSPAASEPPSIGLRGPQQVFGPIQNLLKGGTGLPR